MRRRPPRFTRSDILFPYTTLCRSATAHLPVIFMTGLTETADVLRGLEAGGVDYVTKPLVLEVLVARIAVHLGNARLARRALAALDHAGGRIMVADEAGGIKWATDQTRQFLEELGPAVTAQVESAMRRSEEHTSELQSLMRISYAVF